METTKPRGIPAGAPVHKNFFLKWASLMVLSLALAIIVIDTTLLNVALATIIKDLHTDIQHIQWVITAYSLMLAAFTITGGRLGDIFGRKRMFVMGAIIFAIGSFTASISNSVGVLILGESIIEGIGAALMMPATASLLVSNFYGRDRAIAFGIWGGVAAAASAIGPILGGWLTTDYSWRWGFRINIVVVAILVIGSILIKEYKDDREKPKIDWFGVLLSAIGLGSIAFGVIEASTYGWWTATAVPMWNTTSLNLIGNLSISVFMVIWGFVFLALFILWELRRESKGKTPLVSMGIFKNRQFSAGNLTVMILSLSLTGLIFIFPVFFEAVRGLDAFHTGIALLPLSISLLVGAPLSAFFVKWLYPRTLIIMGLALNAVAFIVLIYTLQPTTSVWALLPGFILAGFGMGLVNAQISNVTLSAVPVYQAGEASGINSTMRQVGSTFGAAIIGSILLTAVAAGITSGIQNSSVIPVQAKPAIVSGLASQASNVEFGGSFQNSSTQNDPVISQEIVRIAKQAVTDGNRKALWGAFVFSILGVLSAFLLPKKHNESHGDAPVAGH